VTDLPTIDPGTVPPLTGPGVVAGWYAVESLVDGGVLLAFWNPSVEDEYAELNADLWVNHNASVARTGLWQADESLDTAIARLRRRLDGFHTAYQLRTHPQALTEQQLRTWLRELNLHPRTAQETT
jgi:hypothetical protein